MHQDVGGSMQHMQNAERRGDQQKRRAVRTDNDETFADTTRETRLHFKRASLRRFANTTAHEDRHSRDRRQECELQERAESPERFQCVTDFVEEFLHRGRYAFKSGMSSLSSRVIWSLRSNLRFLRRRSCTSLT